MPKAPKKMKVQTIQNELPTKLFAATTDWVFVEKGKTLTTLSDGIQVILGKNPNTEPFIPNEVITLRPFFGKLILNRDSYYRSNNSNGFVYIGENPFDTIGSKVSNSNTTSILAINQIDIANFAPTLDDTKEIVPLPNDSNDDIMISLNTITFKTTNIYSMSATLNLGLANNQDQALFLSYDLLDNPVASVRLFTTHNNQSATAQFTITKQTILAGTTLKFYATRVLGSSVGLEAVPSGVAGVPDLPAGRIAIRKYI